MRSGTTAWRSWAEIRDKETPTVALPSGGDLPVALFFPADYAVGMSNLGYHYIYRKLRELGVAVERFFASPIPYRSVERDTLLERFSLILASVAYEGDIPALARWMQAGGIDAPRTMREARETQIVGVGGAMTYINPLALTGIADFIVLGDGLPVLEYVTETLRLGQPREATLRELARHPSILVPSVHIEALRRGQAASLRIERQLDISEDYGHGTWIAPDSAFGATLLLELQRGCMRACSYCTLPSCFGPLRQRPLALLQADLRRIGRTCPFEQVGLVTPEAGDYRDLDALLAEIDALGKGVSFASLRVDALTDGMVHALVRGGRQRLTVAPETGDDAFRARCGKRFTNADLLEALARARDNGVKGAKLYFMIGLPEEDVEAVASIPALCGRIRKETGLGISVNVSPFVPKPGTAWALQPFDGATNLRRKKALLLRELRRIPGVKLHATSVREAVGEYLLSWATSHGAENLAVRFAQCDSEKKALQDFPSVDRDGVLSELNDLGMRSVANGCFAAEDAMRRRQ